MSHAAPPRVSLDEWESTWRLDDDAYELVAGVPTMTPPESGTNIQAAMVLRDRLASPLRTTHRVLPNYGVHLRTPDGRNTVRQPDLVVLPRHLDITRSYIPAVAATLVVEVVSPTSIERDWVTKRAEYAVAGIPSYLIIDVRPDSPRLWLFDRPAAADRDGGGGFATYPGYADPAGYGTSVTLRITGTDPITITSTDFA